VFALNNSAILSQIVPSTGSLSVAPGLASTAPPPQIIGGTGGTSVTPGISNATFGTLTAPTTTAGLGNTVVTTGTGNIDTLLTTIGQQSPNLGGTPLIPIATNAGNLGSFAVSFNLNWTLGNLGVTAATNILRLKHIARREMLACNSVILQIGQQVRSAYLNALAQREQIDVTAAAVAAATEQLRMANLRVQSGVGTNLELIQSQRAYIEAMINQAQAIVTSDQAQAQLLHDTGVISLDTLTAGYKRQVGAPRTNSH
jgi:hypothetical protein